jgi:hypothetical protein
MSRIRFPSVTAILFYVSGFFIQACMTTTQPSRAVVMERSEQGRPAWVDNPRAQEPLSEKWFVFHRSGLQRLELGIRQVQSSALASHCRLIASRVRTDLSLLHDKLTGASSPRGGTDFATLKSDSVAVIDEIVGKISQSDSCPELEPKDVYWESVRKISTNGPETSFSVYVLLRLKPIAFDEVLAMTAESLKLSGKAELMPLAAETMQLMSTGSQQGSDE